MKWFDRWFAKKCKQAWEEETQPREADTGGYNLASAKVRPARLSRDHDTTWD